MEFRNVMLACIFLLVLSACGGGGGSSSNETMPTPEASEDTDSDGVENAFDVDVDGDGLIEINTLDDLNSIRFDLSGSSRSNEQGDQNDLGCPISGCNGYELTSDLSFPNSADRSQGEYWNDGEGWDPIGPSHIPFTGVFEGNGFTISNLFINRSGSSSIGLFTSIESNSIGNFTLENADIECNSNCGILSGEIVLTDSASLSEITISGNISADTGDTGLIAGTLRPDGVGIFNISHLVASGNISSFGDGVGGIFGNIIASQTSFNTTRLSNLTSEVEVEGFNNVGGLIGKLDFANSNASLDLEQFVYSGTAVQGNDRIGGAIGKLELTTQSYTLSRANLNGSIVGRTSVGGFIGEIIVSTQRGSASNSISEIISNTDVSSIESDSGGIIGSVFLVNGSLDLLQCMSTGDVSSGDTLFSNAGGIIGNIRTSLSGGINITNSVSTSNVTARGRGTGGLVGNISGSGEFANLTKNTVSSDIVGRQDLGGLIGSFNSGQTTEAISVQGNVVTSQIHYDLHELGKGGLIGSFDSTAAQVIINANIVDIDIISEDGPANFLMFGNIGGLIGEISTNLRPVSISAGDDWSISGNLILADIEGASPIGGLIGKVETGEQDFFEISANLVIPNIKNFDSSRAGSFAGEIDNEAASSNFTLSENYVQSVSQPSSLVGQLNNIPVITNTILARTIEALQCPTSSNDPSCPSVLYNDWQSLEFDSEPLWNFGESDELPGINIETQVVRDADGDRILD